MLRQLPTLSDMRCVRVHGRTAIVAVKMSDLGLFSEGLAGYLDMTEARTEPMDPEAYAAAYKVFREVGTLLASMDAFSEAQTE